MIPHQFSQPLSPRHTIESNPSFPTETGIQPNPSQTNSPPAPTQTDTPPSPPSSDASLSNPSISDLSTGTNDPTIITDSNVNSSPTNTEGQSFTQSSPFPSMSASFTSPLATPSSLPGLSNDSAILQPVCIGHGVDPAAQGILATLILPSAIGILIWLAFAILRPKFRQMYGIREWFVQQDLRPRPLGTSFFAFLFPHVPLVPSIPTDVSDAGRSAAVDAELFPSDEQLNQRAIFICLLIVFVWTILGLIGALPLYLVATPCLAQFGTPAAFTGGYSTLNDLSLLRLLRLIDAGGVTTTNESGLQGRAAIGFGDGTNNARIRIIVLTALTILLGVLPALIKIIREFNRAVEYRKRWIEVKCDGKELGWLSVKRAPGFKGWGEKRFKDYIVKTGLSSGIDNDGGRGHGRTRSREQRIQGPEAQPLSPEEKADLDVDVQSVFSVCHTERLALLIEERDEILEHLEIAETRYIASFKVTTPDPSIADWDEPRDPNRPHISRPLPLAAAATRRRRRAVNPAFAASSVAPTSFVAPSSYYKLRGLRGVNGIGRFSDTGLEHQPSFSDSVKSRVVGSRFQEVTRNSIYGRIPWGGHVKVDSSGHLGPSSPTSPLPTSPSPSAHENVVYPLIPDPRLHGPNYDAERAARVDEHGMMLEGSSETEDSDWVALTDDLNDYGTEDNGVPPSRRQRKRTAMQDRESFPLRKQGAADSETLLPPHMRLQPSQPFVRPLDGINFEELGRIYTDITQWRSKLKAINISIAEAQRESYNQIAEGDKIKGWLMVGKGLRYLPGIQLIEGRAKEDIRWDVLQNERSPLDWITVWIIAAGVIVLLLAGLAAASGLSLSMAPDFAYRITFLRPILTSESLAAGIASVLTPAVAVVIFVTLALFVINGILSIQGSVSISSGQFLTFKVVFFVLAFFSAMWIIAAGALLFGLQSFISEAGQPRSVASGSVYMGVLAMAIIINIAIIFPGLLVLQPVRLWRVAKAERSAITPRQRFRALYPRIYNPAYTIGPCVLAIVFASAFSLIFPLVGPAVTLLLLLTLVAHRYLVGYVYVRTHSQTGGLIYTWLLKRLGTLLALQPILLGLILLSREFWVEGGILAGTGFLVVSIVEAYAFFKTRSRSRGSLAPITQESLEKFTGRARSRQAPNVDEEGTSLFSTQGGQGHRARGSMASVLEMMSLTLAVMPSPSLARGPVPLATETLDDLTATERAARTHPDAPPHLPPLPFADHAEEMAGILYAPELIAPPPIIWLPKDSAGVARSEAVDLQKYHDLQVTLDVRTKGDVLSRRSSSSRARPSQ